MHIDIPVWLLWTLGCALGIPAAIAIVALAVLGAMFVKCFGSWNY